MTPQLQAAYGGTSVYPPHPGIVPTAAGPTATTQFQNKGYGSRYVMERITFLNQHSKKRYSRI
jgi:hypothetical protein